MAEYMMTDDRAVPTRRMLPSRRATQTFGLACYGVQFAISLGTYVDGEPAEVFVSGGKAGTEVQSLARDAAILMSIALQFGVPLDVIEHALSRNSDGTPQSFLGVLVDQMTKESGHDDGKGATATPVGGPDGDSIGDSAAQADSTPAASG